MSAQTKVWTNADLGKPLTVNRPVVPPSELTALTAHQYRYIAPWPAGPTVVIIGSDGPEAGPWRFPPERPARRLDGTPLDQPPDVYRAYFPRVGRVHLR